MGYETRYDKNQTISLFSMCDCKNEILYMEYDHEIKLVDVCIFKSGYSTRMSLKDRFRYIWNVLVTGKPYADQTMLNLEQIRDIKNFCDTILN